MSVSPAEETLLTRAREQAHELRSEGADARTVRYSLAMMIELYAADHERGIVTVPECEGHREALKETIKSSRWNLSKALAVVVSTVTVCGTLAGLVIKLAG